MNQPQKKIKEEEHFLGTNAMGEKKEEVAKPWDGRGEERGKQKHKESESKRFFLDKVRRVKWQLYCS